MAEDQEDDGPPTDPNGGQGFARTPEDMKAPSPEGVERPDIEKALGSLGRVRAIVSDENEKQSKALKPIFGGIFAALGVLAGITIWSAWDMRTRVDVLRTDVEQRIEALEKRVTELEKK